MRAGKITNSRKAFKDAVLQIAEGLLLRGYGRSSLSKSWYSYLAEYFKEQPKERGSLSEWFEGWLDAMYAPKSLEQKESDFVKAQRQADCSVLAAVNSALQACGIYGFTMEEFEAVSHQQVPTVLAGIVAKFDLTEMLKIPTAKVLAALAHKGLEAQITLGAEIQSEAVSACLVGKDAQWAAYVKRKGKRGAWSGEWSLQCCLAFPGSVQQ